MNYVWFDLGYTLVYLEREKIYQKKLAQLGIDKSVKELEIAFHLADKYFMRERPGALGEKSKEVMKHYYDMLYGYLDMQEGLKTVSMENDEVKWHPFNETIPTLKQLKRLGVGVGLISNWDHTAREVLQQTGIYPYLDEIIISSEVSIEKPDERIFQIACERANVSPNDCLYVGDNYYDDVVGSEQVGMKSLLINRFENIGIEELAGVERISSIASLLKVLENDHSMPVAEEI